MRLPLQLRTTLAMVLAALSWLAAAHAHAQDFPSRVIRVVVAFPAGGPTDFVARLLADKLKPLLGQNVIVENKPGANGAIGAEYVAKGEADGHLLFLTTIGAVAITPHLSKPNYDTLRDFAPITLVVRPSTATPDSMGISRGCAGAPTVAPTAEPQRGPQSRFPGRGLCRLPPKPRNTPCGLLMALRQNPRGPPRD